MLVEIELTVSKEILGQNYRFHRDIRDAIFLKHDKRTTFGLFSPSNQLIGRALISAVSIEQ